MANLMGVDSLKANLTNPGRTYLWDVIVPIPVGGGDTTTFKIRAQSTQIPNVYNDAIHIDYKQTPGIELAGRKRLSHTWTCTFLESEDHLTYDALYAWCQAIVHDVDGIGVGDPLYKTDVYVALVTVAGETYQKFKLKGTWVQTIDAVDLRYADNGVITYNVTFRYDSFEHVTS